MNIADVYAKHNSARISPKKVRSVMDLVRGKSVLEAKKILAFDPTKAAKLMLKVLKSAESNAKNNLNQDPEKMYVSDIYANKAMVLKRGYAAGRLHYRPILKRFSHIVVGLSTKKEEK